MDKPHNSTPDDHRKNATAPAPPVKKPAAPPKEEKEESKPEPHAKKK